jgi:hypothetical protein
MADNLHCCGASSNFRIFACIDPLVAKIGTFLGIFFFICNNLLLLLENYLVYELMTK